MSYRECRKRIWSRVKSFLQRNRFFIFVGTGGLLVRLLMAFGMDYWVSRSSGDGLLPNSDEGINYSIGEAIAAALRAGMPIVSAPNADPHAGYYYVVGLLGWVFEITPLALRLLNAVIGLVGPIAILSLCR